MPEIIKKQERNQKKSALDFIESSFINCLFIDRQNVWLFQ
jgi:hypothetical protein